MGCGADLLLDRPEQEDEQRLREVPMCERGSVGICCHDSPDAEVFDPPVRAFHTVSLRTPVNKLQIRFSSQVASASSDGTARTTAPICPSMSSRSISTQASTILPSATLFRDRPLKVTCLPVGATPMNSPSWVP